MPKERKGLLLASPIECPEQEGTHTLYQLTTSWLDLVLDPIPHLAQRSNKSYNKGSYLIV